MADLKAPWTPEQVIGLNAFQRARLFHPFTCANRGPGHAPTNSLDDVLVATINGWVCPFCDYTQDWAHPFMVEEGLTEAEPKPDPTQTALEEQQVALRKAYVDALVVAWAQAHWVASMVEGENGTAIVSNIEHTFGPPFIRDWREAAAEAAREAPLEETQRG